MGSSSFGSSLVLSSEHLKLITFSYFNHSLFYLLPQENCVCLQLLLFSDTDLVGTEEHLQGEQTRPRRESFRESKGTAIQDMQLTR